MTNTCSYPSAGNGAEPWPPVPVAAGAEHLAPRPGALAPSRARHLRLVGADGPDGDAGARPAWWSPTPEGDGAWAAGPRRRRASGAVRRRRLVLGAVAAALVLLALPLHVTAGAPVAGAARPAALGGHGPVTYVVRPGDTLWSIAERVDPSADPRPLVARLAAQVGSDAIVPGEQLRVP